MYGVTVGAIAGQPMSDETGPDPVYRQALKKLITPGLYGADLENCVLVDHPAVLAATGPNATRQARAEAFIAILEEVIDKRIPPHDRGVARALFAIGEWSGRSVTERHRWVAEKRNRAWSWEVNYRKQPLERDLTTILRALDRNAHTLRNDSAGSSGSAVSDELVRAVGRRRTAYPLDMSLHELHKASLFVQTRVAPYHGRGRDVALEAVMTALCEGRSVLLLGDPGSGKSVALYDLVQRSLRQGMLPFPVRVRDRHEILSRPDWPALRELPGAVLFLDGLDEAVEREDLARDLKELLRLRPALVTSRRREYEHELSPLLADAGFDEVYLMSPWRREEEFGAFLRQLSDAGLLDEPAALDDAVRASEPLSRLVTRPLYARMLTFIGEQGAQGVAEPTGLYEEYLTKLARVAETSAGVAGGGLRLWQTVAWRAHVMGAVAEDTVALSDLAKVLPADMAGHPARRMLDLILDVRRIGNREVGEFVHYSFFEYLVAAHVFDTLISQPDASQLHDVLRHDLTRETRHHLIAQLRATPLHNLRVMLVAAYRTVRSTEPTMEIRAVCNLLVYLLSRTAPQSHAELLELLDAEDDPFLAASLLWALCHLGVSGADRRFFDWLDRDPLMRSLCRGYVLYYYGDMKRDDGPPYLDEPPFRSCSTTLRAIMDMFERSISVEKVPALRRAIDLYTFLDILCVRNMPVSKVAHEQLRRFHESLLQDGVDARLWSHLAEMMELLGPRHPDAPSKQR